jgi:hypothetical protein
MTNMPACGVSREVVKGGDPMKTHLNFVIIAREVTKVMVMSAFDWQFRNGCIRHWSGAGTAKCLHCSLNFLHIDPHDSGSKRQS